MLLQWEGGRKEEGELERPNVEMPKYQAIYKRTNRDLVYEKK